jgi:AcrR family transcriptional regulator
MTYTSARVKQVATSQEQAAASLLDLWHRWENPGRSAGRGLNLRRIASAAVGIADRDGLAGVSMARVAEQLGYTTMALYRHVSGKDELVQLMIEAAFEGQLPDIAEGTPWRPGMEQWARALLCPFQASPWLAEVNPTGLNAPSQLAIMDQGLGVLQSTGLPAADQAAVLLAVNGHILSYATMRANLLSASSGTVAPMGTLMVHLAAAGRLPWAARALAEGVFDSVQIDEPDDFEFGLALILDGVEVLVARTVGSRPRD